MLSGRLEQSLPEPAKTPQITNWQGFSAGQKAPTG